MSDLSHTVNVHFAQSMHDKMVQRRYGIKHCPSSDKDADSLYDILEIQKRQEEASSLGFVLGTCSHESISEKIKTL
jgi:hypothetical protein